MLNTMSKFYYGHHITTSNRDLPFNDGSGAKTATLNVGDYSLTEFITEISRALNAASTTVTFTVTVNRSTRLITIAGTGSFDLLLSSGASSNPFSLMGYTSGSDLTGTNTYTGNAVTGSEFLPQFKLQKYVAFGDEQRASHSNVATSANGTVQVINYGTDDFMTCEIAYQTNNNTTGSAIENQTNGLDNLRTFLQYIVNKRKIEFIPDRDTPATFTKCMIESTSVSGDGTGYKLNEYLGRLPGFYSSGTLKFRKMS